MGKITSQKRSNLLNYSILGREGFASGVKLAITPAGPRSVGAGSENASLVHKSGHGREPRTIRGWKGTVHR